MAYTKEQLINMTVAAANRYGLNPAIAVAQIRQESGFNPNARSAQGAMGIAQFMPGTWAQWGQGSAYDPVAALDAYGRLMRYLLDKFSGDYRLALAGYHSGEGSAAKALANCRGNPKTCNYVNKIRASAGVSPTITYPVQQQNTGVNPAIIIIGLFAMVLLLT